MAANLILYNAKFPHGLMFHRFHNQASSKQSQGSIASDEFERILHFVGIKNILSPEEWLSKLKDNKLKAKDLCLTFDDGLKCQYDICLPILEKYNLKAFWFIYSSVCEGKLGKFEIYNYFMARYFSDIDGFFRLFFSRCKKPVLNQLDKYKFKQYLRKRQEICPFYSTGDLKFRFIRDELLPQEEFENIMDKIMQDKNVAAARIAKDLWLSNSALKILNHKGHCIGLHSYDHPFRLSRLPYQGQYQQYIKNYGHLKRICNKEIICASYPLNSYNKDTLEIFKRLGILCSFRSNMARPHGKKINPNRLEIAREDAANILWCRKV